MIESWGRGIERIMEACQEAGTPEPEVRYEQTGLWMVFSYLPEHQAGTPLETPATPQVTPQVTPQITPQITPQVERLLRVLEGTMDRAQLKAALDLKDRKSFRDLYLQPAIEAGLIRMTMPDKPNSRLQRYLLASVETPATPQVAPQITPQVERLLRVLEGTMDRDQLQAALNLKDRKSFRELYLQPALEAGLVRMTIPDKPNSRLQSYFLAPAGEAYRAEREEKGDPS
jgi:hypothetical protein